jgi:RHS repeat-associated protein
LASTTFLPVSQQFTTRSYTGQEAMDAVGLINYGGRIYDPKLARFIQADPIVQNAEDLQAYNRYAYVRNNPLTLTDPSGYSWFSKARKKAHKWRDKSHNFSPTYHTTKDSTQYLLHPTHERVSSTFGVIRGIDNYLVDHTWAQVAVTAVATTFGGAIGAAAVAEHLAHAAGAGIDQALNAGIIAGASAMAFSAIGGYYGNTWTVGRVGVTAVAGGVTAEASGGRFIDGFKMSAATALFSYGADRVGQIGNNGAEGRVIVYDEHVICAGNTGCTPIGVGAQTYDFKAFALNPDLGKTLVDFEKMTTWPVRTFTPLGQEIDRMYDISKIVYSGYQRDTAAFWGNVSDFVYGETMSKLVPGVPSGAVGSVGGDLVGNAVENEIRGR